MKNCTESRGLFRLICPLFVFSRCTEQTLIFFFSFKNSCSWLKRLGDSDARFIFSVWCWDRCLCSGASKSFLSLKRCFHLWGEFLFIHFIFNIYFSSVHWSYFCVFWRSGAHFVFLFCYSIGVILQADWWTFVTPKCSSWKAAPAAT